MDKDIQLSLNKTQNGDFYLMKFYLMKLEDNKHTIAQNMCSSSYLGIFYKESRHMTAFITVQYLTQSLCNMKPRLITKISYFKHLTMLLS